MSPLATLLSRLCRLFVLPEEHGRPTEVPKAGGGRLGDDQAQINRLMMVKIGWTLSFLMVLATFAQDGDRLKLFEQLLNTYSLMDTLLAVLLRDKWSAAGLSRWDEVIFFVTISMGLRLFA